MLVTSVAPLRAWMFDGGLVVFRTSKAAPGDTQDAPDEMKALGFNLWTQDRASTVVWRCAHVVTEALHLDHDTACKSHALRPNLVASRTKLAVQSCRQEYAPLSLRFASDWYVVLHQPAMQMPLTVLVTCSRRMHARRVTDLKDHMHNSTGADSAFEGLWQRVKAAVGASSDI